MAMSPATVAVFVIFVPSVCLGASSFSCHHVFFCTKGMAAWTSGQSTHDTGQHAFLFVFFSVIFNRRFKKNSSYSQAEEHAA